MEMEYLGAISDKIRGAGALDVLYFPVYMKKGRIGISLSVTVTAEKLQKILGEAGSAAYQQATQQQAQAEGQDSATRGEQSRPETSGPDGEKVVDADFQVKDEK
jgi:uncharacterized protein (DUF111 family)